MGHAKRPNAAAYRFTLGVGRLFFFAGGCLLSLLGGFTLISSLSAFSKSSGMRTGSRFATGLTPNLLVVGEFLL